jgi:uncharacterized repeat protein (TIGR02543 family)
MASLRSGRVPLTLLSAAAVAAATLVISPASPAQAAPTGYTCSGFSLGSLAYRGSHSVGGVAVCVFQSDGSTDSTPWSMPVEITSFDVLAVGAGGGGGGRGPIQTYVSGLTIKSAAGGGAGGGGEIRLLAGATGSTVAVSVGSFGAAGAVESAGSNGGDTTVLIGTAAVTSKGGNGGAAGSGSGGTGSGGAGGGGGTGGSGIGSTVLDSVASGGTGGGYSGIWGNNGLNGTGGLLFGVGCSAGSGFGLFQDSYLGVGGGGGGGAGIANSNGGTYGEGTNSFSCDSSGGDGARASGRSWPGNESWGRSGGGGGGGAYKGYDPFTTRDEGSEAAAGGARGGAYIAFQLPWKVTYAANSASSGTAPSAAPAAPGSSFTVAANSGSLTRTGYTFGGWNTAADGSGTTYAAGSGSFSANANVELFAKWISMPAPPVPPAPPAGDGAGSAVVDPTPTPTPTPSATTSPSTSATASVAPASPVRLDPIATSQNPNIPTGGVPAGGSVFLVNGQPLPLAVSPNAKSDPVALVFSAPGMNMRLEGRGDDADPLGLTSKQALILQSEPTGARSGSMGLASRSGSMARKQVQPVAQTSGDGFAPSTPVKLFLLPSTYLGEVTTDATGAFAGSVPIPAGVAPGVHTLQANGFAPDLSVRSLSIGVLVKPTAVAVKAYRATSKVYFDSLSSVLTAEGMSTLKTLVKKTGKNAVRTESVGYVQGTTVTSNDQALSRERATNVAAYLRSLGLKGAYVVRGDGVAKESGALARRVNVAVTYQR